MIEDWGRRGAVPFFSFHRKGSPEPRAVPGFFRPFATPSVFCKQNFPKGMVFMQKSAVQNSPGRKRVNPRTLAMTAILGAVATLSYQKPAKSAQGA